MSRWKITTALSLLSVAVALAAGGTSPVPAASPPAPATAAVAGPLQVRAGLEQAAILAGDAAPHFLVVEIGAPEADAGPRAPVHLSLVIDASGSMAAEGKWDAALASARAALGALGPEDTLSVVAFSDRARVVVPQGPVLHPGEIAARIEALRPGGSTALASGLETGLAELGRTDAPGVRRAIVLSDGFANVGPTSTPHLAALAAGGRAADVTTSAMGLGYEFDERLLTALSDAGGGTYRYVNHAQDLGGLFTEELDRVGHVVGRKVEVEVDLAPGVRLDRVFGYEEFDGERTATGFRAWVGDVHAGETRKVVARVMVPPSGEVGTVRVRCAADARCEWEHAVVAARATDATEAAASVDSAFAAHVMDAVTGAALDEGNLAWKGGRAGEGRREMVASAGWIRTAARRWGLSARGADVLDQSAAELEEMEVGTREGTAGGMRQQLRALGYLE